MKYPNLLVFAELPDPDEPTFGLRNTLSYMDVTLIGSCPLADGESVEDVSEERKEELRHELDDFEEHGIRAETELAFGEARWRRASGTPDATRWTASSRWGTCRRWAESPSRSGTAAPSRTPSASWTSSTGTR